MTSNFASARRRLRCSTASGTRLEVPERLVERDPQAQRGRPLAHLGRVQRRADEVRLEELDGVEARLGGREELLLERAAQADGR